MVAVLVPSAEGLDALEGGGSHAVAQLAVAGELFEVLGEEIDAAGLDNEAFDAVGEEVFGTCGSGGEDGTAAGHCLTLDEREAFFDGGQAHDVAAAHVFDQLGLRKRTEEADIFSGEPRDYFGDSCVGTADNGEALVRVLERGEGLEQILDALAQTERSDEEDFEAVVRRVGDPGKFLEPHAVRDDVHLIRGNAVFDVGAAADL